MLLCLIAQWNLSISSRITLVIHIMVILDETTWTNLIHSIFVNRVFLIMEHINSCFLSPQSLLMKEQSSCRRTIRRHNIWTGKCSLRVIQFIRSKSSRGAMSVVWLPCSSLLFVYFFHFTPHRDSRLGSSNQFFEGPYSVSLRLHLFCCGVWLKTVVNRHLVFIFEVGFGCQESSLPRVSGNCTLQASWPFTFNLNLRLLRKFWRWADNCCQLTFEVRVVHFWTLGKLWLQ